MFFITFQLILIRQEEQTCSKYQFFYQKNLYLYITNKAQVVSDRNKIVSDSHKKKHSLEI